MNLIKNLTNLEIYWIGLLFIPIIYWYAPKKIRFWFISLLSVGIIGIFDLLSLTIIFSAAIIVDSGIRFKKIYPKKTNIKNKVYLIFNVEIIDGFLKPGEILYKSNGEIYIGSKKGIIQILDYKILIE